jgi:hypothetical protein
MRTVVSGGGYQKFGTEAEKVLTDGNNITLPIGLEGLTIETEQDPDSANPKTLTNVGDGALKHAVNVDFQGSTNLKRRKGYSDAFHPPAVAHNTFDVHYAFAAGGNAIAADKTWQDVMDYSEGIRGLDRYTYVDNRQVKAGHGYDLQRYTVFATNDGVNPPATGFPWNLSHTYHWRNPGTSAIRQLEVPTLDRLTTAGHYGFPPEFSDVNTNGFEPARFWNYETWERGGGRETYLLGTCGGHYTCPDTPDSPIAWNTGGAFGPDAGSFDIPNMTNPLAFQRRVMIWFPEWYAWWAALQTPAYPAGTEEIGLNYWFAPFIWYFDQGHNGMSDFYAEPCGRFMRRYGNSLFMARIERSYLIPGAGTGDDDSVGWDYNQSAYMYSFYGYPTGMVLGTPPVYPFSIPGEPRERVWGCAANGFALNRHNLFRPECPTPIVGLETWNDSLYIMKPTGFGEISGKFSGNFSLTDLQMSQGPAGAFAWCKADEGIYYCTKKGLYLFDGNPASQNICLSDGRVKKIFAEDIDWGSCTDLQTGEVVGVIMSWDKNNRQVLISYPKKGEQGAGTGLPKGCPTRMLVFDTLGKRFTEWILPLPIGQGTPQGQNPCPGIMLGGKEPTDDDYMMATHPIGNSMGNNSNGRLLFHINYGFRDNMELQVTTGDPDPASGDTITFNATSKDYTFGTLDSKIALGNDKLITYTNDGHIKRRVTFNYYDTQDENDAVYPVTGTDGYIQTISPIHRTRAAQSTSGATGGWTTVSFSWYHDEFDYTDPANTNPPDGPIEFVGHQITIQGKQGNTR